MNGANFLASISSWFAQRQPRERVIVAAGAVIVVMAAIYMALLPSLSKATELEQRYQILQSDLQWLSEQGQTASRLVNNCVSKSIQKGATKDVITRLIRRNQIQLKTIAEQSQGQYLVNFESTSANRILQLTHQLACQGLSVNTLSVRPGATAKTIYTARMEVQYVK